MSLVVHGLEFSLKCLYSFSYRQQLNVHANSVSNKDDNDLNLHNSLNKLPNHINQNTDTKVQQRRSTKTQPVHRLARMSYVVKYND